MEHNKQGTALLVMDMQSAFIQNFADKESIINQTMKAIAFARNNKIPVIYVVVGFRQGMPEVSINNKGFTSAKERLSKTDMNEFAKIEPALAPLADELIITKRRISAFTGSDLEVVLKSFGIQHMVSTGISTSGVVLSTLREAADKDYKLTVLSDCCADNDEEVHKVLITKIFPKHAEVVTAEEWSNL